MQARFRERFFVILYAERKLHTERRSILTVAIKSEIISEPV